MHVEHDALQHSGERLGQAKNDLEAKLTEIQGQIQDLISSGFVTDKASASFGEAARALEHRREGHASPSSSDGQYLGKASAAFEDVDSQFTVKL